MNPESDKDLPRDILGFRTITSMLAILGEPKMEINDRPDVPQPDGMHVLNSLATLLVRRHEIVAVVADENSIPQAVNIIVCLEGKDTLTNNSQHVFPAIHIATANPRDPKGKSNPVRDSLTHMGEPKLLKPPRVDIRLSDPWPHIIATW
jgi:hypothetical protein